MNVESNKFQTYMQMQPGANNVAVEATDASGNVRTNTYQVTVANNLQRTLTYDADGNLLNDGQKSYTWDALNRLTRITYADNTSTEFTYNGVGQRIKIVEKNASGSVTSMKNFIWSNGSQPTEERDASNNVTKRFFIQGQQIGGTNYYYTLDHLGSVREMTDSTGAIHARYDYDPYGRTTKLSGDLDADFQYAGYYSHTASGLDLTWFRAYDANLGRWLSRDPIAESGGINLYGYVANDPIGGIDPFGFARYEYDGQGLHFMMATSPIELILEQMEIYSLVRNQDMILI
ncbi:MAG: hypothetical protein PHD76_13165 [Methylacidiphilales bacterium]|nr:hypothetical protein [Candidatus Methylacidiphilales bacterium]